MIGFGGERCLWRNKLQEGGWFVREHMAGPLLVPQGGGSRSNEAGEGGKSAMTMLYGLWLG